MLSENNPLVLVLDLPDIPDDDEEGESESLLFLPPSFHCGAPPLPQSPSSPPRRLFLFRRGDDACDAGGEGVGESCAERNAMSGT